MLNAKRPKRPREEDDEIAEILQSVKIPCTSEHPDLSATRRRIDPKNSWSKVQTQLNQVRLTIAERGNRFAPATLRTSLSSWDSVRAEARAIDKEYPVVTSPSTPDTSESSSQSTEASPTLESRKTPASALSPTVPLIPRARKKSRKPTLASLDDLADAELAALCAGMTLGADSGRPSGALRR